MNTIKTAFLMALLMGVMVAVGGAFGGHTGATIMLVLAIAMNFFVYWNSASMALAAYNAQEVSREEAPQLYQLIENLAANAEIPMPRVYLIPSDVPNAFATGRNPSHAAVAVTTGIMRALDYNELSGVLAHELSHVKHRDILISSIAATMATFIGYIANIAQWAAIFGTGRSDDDEDGGGLIGLLVTIIVAPIAASLIQLAISRSREYDADKSGGEICGNPNYLADALEKIEYYAKHMAEIPATPTTEATAHMFIINPLSGSGKALVNLFSTHPATEERIARLRQQARDMGLA